MRFWWLILLLVTGCSIKKVEQLSPTFLLSPNHQATIISSSILRASHITNSLSLTWDLPSDLTGIVGYQVQVGTNENHLFRSDWVEGTHATNWTMQFMWQRKHKPARLFFSVVSLWENGTRSDPSNMVHYPPYPRIPTGYTLRWTLFEQCEIWISSDLQRWDIIDGVTGTDYFIPIDRFEPPRYFKRVKSFTQTPLELTIELTTKSDPRDDI